MGKHPNTFPMTMNESYLPRCNTAQPLLEEAYNKPQGPMYYGFFLPPETEWFKSYCKQKRIELGERPNLPGSGTEERLSNWIGPGFQALGEAIGCILYH